MISFPLQFTQGMLLAQFLWQDFVSMDMLTILQDPFPRTRGPAAASLYFHVQEC